MAIREVRVFDVREVVPFWRASESLRTIERVFSQDRKTVRRYVTANRVRPMESGLNRKHRRCLVRN